jgi:hypothetical protein
MHEQIKSLITEAHELEMLYRSNKKEFSKAFFEIYPQISDNKIAEFWKVRLEYSGSKSDIAKTKSGNIFTLILVCLLAGFLIKIPQFFDLARPESFYAKNTGLILFFSLSLYVIISRNISNFKGIVISVLIFFASAIYINVLPFDTVSHSIDLAYLHMPLLIWCLYGFVYIDFDIKDKLKRIDFIKYNGDLAILTTIILIAGGILSSITMGLFMAIDLQIEEFYFEYIVILGLISAPIVATYIVRKFPGVANKIAPIIASIFSPLVLITLTTYLISIFITGKDPYNDRDFLLIFNIMLVAVMGIIVFSVSETSKKNKQRFNETVLLLLSIITLIIDIIALSAILYRLGEYGFTPNRIVVLGSNILIFVNLLLIMIELFKINFKNTEIEKLEYVISKYLPVYAFWTVFVVFVLPLIFGYK